MNNLQKLKIYAHEIGATEKLLKCIYEGSGADLQKILRAKVWQGAWTIKKVCDLLNPAKDEQILFITDKQRGDYHVRKYGFIYYNEYYKADNRVSGMDAFYSKKEFNEARKSHEYKTIFLLFKASDIKGNKYDRPGGYNRIKKELTAVNNLNRYEITNIINGRTWENVDYIAAGDVKNLERNGMDYIRFDGQPANLGQIIDKSGYYLITRRQQLKQAADSLRAKKKKEEVNGMDFSNDLAEIEAGYKKTVAGYLEKLNTLDFLSDDFNETLKNLRNFTTWDFGSFTTHKERILKRDYETKERIMDILQAYKNKLAEEKI